MTANDLPKDGPSRPQAEAVPYQGDPLPNVAEDLVIPNVLSLDFDERLWVPQAKVRFIFLSSFAFTHTHTH